MLYSGSTSLALKAIVCRTCVDEKLLISSLILILIFVFSCTFISLRFKEKEKRKNCCCVNKVRYSRWGRSRIISEVHKKSLWEAFLLDPRVETLDDLLINQPIRSAPNHETMLICFFVNNKNRLSWFLWLACIMDSIPRLESTWATTNNNQWLLLLWTCELMIWGSFGNYVMIWFMNSFKLEIKTSLVII